MAVNIQLEWTPNPNTLKYVVDRPLLPFGALNITTREAAEEKSPLAKKLMGIQGVTGVMLGSNFITVTKGNEGEWDMVNDEVMNTLDGHLSSDEPVVFEEALVKSEPRANGGEIERRIHDILEAEIRPAVMMDGGDITLDRYEDGIVFLHMKGSCSGCPSSTMTLKMGIENRLRELIPEVQEVVPV